MENICSELRYLPVTQTLADEQTLLILCDLSYANSDAVEVAMVTTTHNTLADVATTLKNIDNDLLFIRYDIFVFVLSDFERFLLLF